MGGVDKSKWPKYRIYVMATHNNTIITFTDADGRPRGWSSAGECGFSGTRGSTPEAAYAATIKIIAKVMAEYQKVEFRLDIYLKGFGQGRLSFISTLAAPEGEPLRYLLHGLTDRTPIKIGGTRGKKARRV
jgi:small subunit ribosomal protein S11